MSLTVGVACLTLAIVGGILAGPAILDCSKSSDGFGACLRGKVSDAGLLPADSASHERTVLSSELPPPSAPPVVAEIPPPAPGWIDARAGEYEPPPSAAADLIGRPGVLLGMGGLMHRTPAVVARVALAAPVGTLLAGHDLPLALSAGEASLAMSNGDLIGNGTSTTANGTSADVALLETSGDVTAFGREGIAGPGASTVLSPRPGELAASGAGGTQLAPFDAEANPDVIYLPLPAAAVSAGRVSAEGSVVALEASIDTSPRLPTGAVEATGIGRITLAPLSPAATPDVLYLTLSDATGSVAARAGEATASTTLEARVAPPMPRQLRRQPAAAAAEPVKTVTPHPKQTVRYDPNYPDVTVLPPPSTGANSSFTTLELD